MILFTAVFINEVLSSLFIFIHDFIHFILCSIMILLILQLQSTYLTRETFDATHGSNTKPRLGKGCLELLKTLKLCISKMHYFNIEILSFFNTLQPIYRYNTNNIC